MFHDRQVLALKWFTSQANYSARRNLVLWWKSSFGIGRTLLVRGWRRVRRRFRWPWRIWFGNRFLLYRRFLRRWLGIVHYRLLGRSNGASILQRNSKLADLGFFRIREFVHALGERASGTLNSAQIVAQRLILLLATECAG